MFEILHDCSDEVEAVRAAGTSLADVCRIRLIPVERERSLTCGSVRALCPVSDRDEGFAAGAACSDLILSVSSWSLLGRQAVVTDVTWIGDAMLLFPPFFHHSVRVNAPTALAEARRWNSEKDAGA